MNAYEKLENRFARRAKIGEALGVLGWDRATMMPEGGASGRAEQVAAGLQVAPGQVATRNISIRLQKPGERMQFQGIGAMLSKRNDGIRVERVFEGHPASQFGLESRDFILAVDGESVENLPLTHVIEKIRGRRGVPVELEIERPSQGRMTLEIVRGQVIVKRQN
jgi:S1-C subfamily serine protease